MISRVQIYENKNYALEIEKLSNCNLKFSDIEYLCKYYEHDGPELMSLALGISKESVKQKIYKLKLNNEYNFYKEVNLFW